MDELSSLVVAVHGKADDWMFDLAQREGEGTDPFMRSPRLEAMNTLRATRATIERQFARHYEALFDDLIESPRVASDNLHLSLLGEHELEQQLASDLIVEALQRAHGHTLDALARGLGRILGVESLPVRRNPLSALNFGHALQHAVQGIELPSMLRVVLYKYYERELLQRFPEILDRLLQRFTAAGLVLRRIDRGGDPRQGQAVRAGSVGDDTAAQQARFHAAAGGGWVPPAGDHHFGSSGDSNVFALLREMLRALRPQQAVTPTEGAAAMQGERRLLQTTEMLSVLSLMQSEVPPSVLETMERHEASLSVLLKRDLLDSARRIGLSPRRPPDFE